MNVQAQRFASKTINPLLGVSDEAWLRFVAALESHPVGSVSDSGGLGSYAIRPRRLVELGYASGLRSTRTDKGRQIQVCDFVLPWTQVRFLADPVAQFAALSRSVSLYYHALLVELKRPEGVSMSGALVILHVGGKGALASWPDLFENTRALYEKARGAF